jgi:hypothetical protein
MSLIAIVVYSILYNDEYIAGKKTGNSNGNCNNNGQQHDNIPSPL